MSSLFYNEVPGVVDLAERRLSSMHVKKIVERLLDVMESEETKKKKRKEAIEKLVEKLRKKEKRLKRNIRESSSKKDLVQWEKKLDLCVEHRKKGESALDDL